MKNSALEVYGKVMEKGYFINNHNNDKEESQKWVFVLFQYEDWYDKEGLETQTPVEKVMLCPVSGPCCLNPLVLGKDDEVHLSTSSIGGNIALLPSMSLDEIRCTCRMYNEQVKYGGKIIGVL